MMLQQNNLLSVIVIGLNEESGIAKVLHAVFQHRPKSWEIEVFYVDSGSSDNSVAIASAIEGVQVLHLEDKKPSAAKARNVGLRVAKGKYIQLLDGDSVVEPGWMDRGIAALEVQAYVSCVFGHCIEMRPEQSLYMQVCGLDWHVKPGEYRLCGGNALWRKTTFDTVGLFDTELRLGEEPDLCYRVRAAGGRIVCIDVPMVKHDLGMLTFSDYWTRAENSGKAYVRVALRYWRSKEKLWLYETLRNFIEPFVWLTLLVGGWVLHGLGTGLGFVMLWWALRSGRTAWKNRHRTPRAIDALLYGLHTQFIRLPIAIGQLKALWAIK